MIELGLIVIICALLVYSAWKDRAHQEQLNKLHNALVAKNAEELRQLVVAEKIKPIESKPQAVDEAQPDLIPIDQADDEQWAKANGMDWSKINA